MRYLILFFLSFSSLLIADTPLERLIEGNRRYCEDRLKYPHRSVERRQAILAVQEPFATIVGCSDSRVSPEIVFDQGLGDLFVVRVAGNVVGPLELDSIEYSAIYLHSSLIVVMGHENCGAVNAVVQGTTKDIEAVAQLIAPAVELAKEKEGQDLLVTAIKNNAINMRNYLRKTPAIEKLINEKKMEVHAAYYHLKTGRVEFLD